MSKKFLSPIKLAQGTSNPASGSTGDVFYNTTDQTIYAHNGSAWAVAESSLPAGTVVQWTTNTAPGNWLICDGTAVSRTTYATLFAAIGTTYGVGNGSTTFNLPDMRGRVVVGKNTGTFATLGGTGGAETVTLDVTQIPSHTHTQDAHSHTGSTSSDGNHSHSISVTGGAHTHALPLGQQGGQNANDIAYRSGTSNGYDGAFRTGFESTGSGYNSSLTTHTHSATASTTGAHTHTFTTSSVVATNQYTGGGGAHTNLQPYVTLNYIIKTSSGTTAGDSLLTSRVTAIETTTVQPIALGGTGSSTGVNLVPTGAIMMWYTNTPPTGWLICNGQSTTGYSALAAVVGATVPNMQQRVPVGKNATGTFATLGATGGSETVTLIEANLPSHTHTGTTAASGAHTHTFAGTTGNSGNHQHNIYYAGSTMLQYINTTAGLGSNMGGLAGYYNSNNLATGTNGDHNHSYSGTTSGASTTHTHTFTTDPTGSGTSVPNLQPYIVVNYIIKT